MSPAEIGDTAFQVAHEMANLVGVLAQAGAGHGRLTGRPPLVSLRSLLGFPVGSEAVEHVRGSQSRPPDKLAGAIVRHTWSGQE
jgi:hypothetical protein